MGKKIVTAALPYANGPIHLGSLLEYIQTDIYVRFLKLIGEDAVYICASDAHGTPIEINAHKQNITPKELVQKYFEEHQADFKKYLIQFDSFYTTDSEENKFFAESIFKKLQEADLIYTKEVENFFDTKLERFLPDRYVKGECPKCGAPDQYGDVCERCNATYKPVDLKNPYSVLSNETPIRKSSKHYFYKLSEQVGQIQDWLEGAKDLQPEIVNYVKSWLKEGLQDWDISRDGPYYGFNIPGEENKFFYVWLDAPMGYLASYANFLNKGNTPEERAQAAADIWNNGDTTVSHIIGKDIIYFHYLFWPSVLISAGYKPPTTLTVHGFLTVNGEKMSKSRGTFLTAKDFAEKYPPEFLRYYYASMLSRKMADVDLNVGDFIKKVNSEIVGNIANFCYRVLTFIKTKQNGEIGNLDDNDPAIKEFTDKVQIIKESYQDLNFKEAVKQIMALAHVANGYFQHKQPWKMDSGEELDKVLTLSANFAKNLAIVIQPILPEFSAEVFRQLNMSHVHSWDEINFSLQDHTIGEPKPLANKIEKPEEEQREEFPLNLKIGKITRAEKHPESDKLVVLQVDVGEPRQLVAGIQQNYSLEELKDRNIVVLTNLKKAKLGGIHSEGMLLAAGDDARLLEPKGNPGDQIYPGKKDSYNIKTGRIEYKKFQQIKLIVKDKKVTVNGTTLATDQGEVTVDAEDDVVVS